MSKKKKDKSVVEDAKKFVKAVAAVIESPKKDNEPAKEQVEEVKEEPKKTPAPKKLPVNFMY